LACHIITKDNFHTLMDIIIVDSICINMVQQTSTMTSHVVTWLLKKKHDPMLDKHQTMTSFPLLLKHMGVIILILIHSWLFKHRPLLHVINDFF
jgi:hypothetical protein